jgi:MFS family permease
VAPGYGEPEPRRDMSLSGLLRNRDFDLYWSGVVLSQVGSRGTITANLYQVYLLTGSVVRTGLIGAAQAVALLLMSPLGGVYADRVNRQRVVQAAQAVAMLVAAALAIVTFSGQAQVWHVVVAVLLTTAAEAFDQPARQALIPALVPRHQLPEAFALLNPSREAAVLVGPALAGILIAIGGPGLMYAVDVGTYAVLIVVLALIHAPRTAPGPRTTLRRQIIEGLQFVKGRRIVWMLMSLDLAATVLGAYRVVLPALATDVLHVGPAGYGLLSAAPSAGALVATYVVFRVVATSRRLGRVLLVATVGYGLATALLSHTQFFVVALAVGMVIGGFDAMATTIRHAAVQLETPDRIRGRVSSIYQVSSRGGPAVGDLVIGLAAGVVGPVVALTCGGLLAALYPAALLARPNEVREYAGARPLPLTDPEGDPT